MVDGSLSVGELYDAWRANDLEGLRARRNDVDLEALVPGWTAWLRDRVRPTTADHYLAHVRTLIPTGQPFYRSQLTAPAVARWLASRTALVQKRRPSSKQSRRKTDPPARPLSGSSRRKYLAAVQRFVAYLMEIGVLPANPLRDLKAPRPSPPRSDFLELPDVQRVVERAAPPFRAILDQTQDGRNS